ACLRDLRHGLLDRLSATSREDDLGALPAEHEGDGAAEARARARHDGHFVLESHPRLLARRRPSRATAPLLAGRNPSRATTLLLPRRNPTKATAPLLDLARCRSLDCRAR